MPDDRRRFLAKLLIAAGGFVAAGAGALRWLLPGVQRPGAEANATAQAADTTNLVWVEGTDPYKNTRAAVAKLGGMGRFVKEGQRVTVLPNVGWARKEVQAACTNPRVVRAVIDMCAEEGAKSITAFCNPCNDIRLCLDLSGIGATIEASAGRFEQVNKNGWRRWEAARGCTHLKEFDVYRLVEDCDVLINVPIAKHHGGSQLTMCCKNLMGAVKDRGMIHQSLDEGIADLAMTIPQQLCVLDATRILLRHGPTGGNLDDTKQTNTLIAGLNPAEVDALGTTLFGQKPAEIRHLALLAKRGFAEIDPAKLSYARVSA